MSKNKHGTVLSFDVGLKRTGTAIAQTATDSARPAGVLAVANGRHDWAQVDRIIKQWQPTHIIIGKASDTDLALKKAVNRLVSHIQQNHKTPINLVDETLTTVSANALLAERNYSTTKRRELRDQVAACLILETWLNDQRRV